MPVRASLGQKRIKTPMIAPRVISNSARWVPDLGAQAIREPAARPHEGSRACRVPQVIGASALAKARASIRARLVASSNPQPPS